MFLLKHGSYCDDETLDRVEYQESKCLYNKAEGLKIHCCNIFISNRGVFRTLSNI